MDHSPKIYIYIFFDELEQDDDEKGGYYLVAGFEKSRSVGGVLAQGKEICFFERSKNITNRGAFWKEEEG